MARRSVVEDLAGIAVRAAVAFPVAGALALPLVLLVPARGREALELALLLASAGAFDLLSAAWRRARRAARVSPSDAASVAAALMLCAGAGAGALLANPASIAGPLVREDPARPVDAVFVFSGDVDFHRTRHGAEVFRRLGARWFVVSGAGAGGDSGALMAKAAEADGVPRSAILVEETATTTRENVVRSAPLLAAHAIRSVAVVTSRFHARRAALAAERAWRGVDVISRPVPADDPHECGDAGWTSRDECVRAARSEWEKLVGYLLHGWL